MALATLWQTRGRLGCRNRKHLAFRTGLRQTLWEGMTRLRHMVEGFQLVRGEGREDDG